MDAKSEEPRLPNSQEPQPTESLQSLIEGILSLVEQLRVNNNIMIVLSQQNAVIIDSLIDPQDADEQPMVDMEGNPIRTS